VPATSLADRISALKNYQRKPNGASPHQAGEPCVTTILAPLDHVDRLAEQAPSWSGGAGICA
jgi:hypothetical protein